MKKTNKFLMNVLDRLKNYASGIIQLQNRIFSNTDALLQERFRNAKKEIESINAYENQKTELLTIKLT